MVDVIERKRDGYALSEEEIAFFVRGYTDGKIPDYQAAALLMAIVLRGMDETETAILTDQMMHSGETIDLKKIPGIKVDKHSTGGVGDKTSLVLGPLVAACGGKLAKMSGRGLGHTGGTLDKMESIPGTRTALSDEEFTNQVKEIGIAIIGQTAEIDPADKKLYALRDVTATVESIPLIASSIMSKKLASGSDAILLDVKYGSGAFMKNVEDARKLAKAMVAIGDKLGRDTKAVITSMEEPLGFAVGNNLEVKEAIETLKGRGPQDLVELCKTAGALMLVQSHIAADKEEGERLIQEAIENGKGFEKLKEFIGAQGGDVSYLDDVSKFPVAKYIHEITSPKAGYITRIDALGIGLSAMKLGAGRAELTDPIDYTAGIVLRKKVGDYVEEGDVLALAYTNKEEVAEVLRDIGGCFLYSKKKKAAPALIKDIVS